MKIPLFLLGLLALGGCNLAVTRTPLFDKSDTVDAPIMKPGVWRAQNDGDCPVDEAKPLIDWPKCGGGVVFSQGTVGYFNRDAETPVWTVEPFFLAAGDPAVLQAAAHVGGDFTMKGQAYLYAGVEVTARDAGGRATGLAFWPVQCGPPDPAGERESLLPQMTKNLLPGMNAVSKDAFCSTTSKDVMRAAAIQSRQWIPKVITGRWVRDGER